MMKMVMLWTMGDDDDDDGDVEVNEEQSVKREELLQKQIKVRT